MFTASTTLSRGTRFDDGGVVIIFVDKVEGSEFCVGPTSPYTAELASPQVCSMYGTDRWTYRYLTSPLSESAKSLRV